MAGNNYYIFCLQITRKLNKQLCTWMAHSCYREIEIGPCEASVQTMAPKNWRLSNVIWSDSAFENHPLLANRTNVVIFVVEILVWVVSVGHIVRQTEIKTNGGHPLWQEVHDAHALGCCGTRESGGANFTANLPSRGGVILVVESVNGRRGGQTGGQHGQTENTPPLSHFNSTFEPKNLWSQASESAPHLRLLTFSCGARSAATYNPLTSTCTQSAGKRPATRVAYLAHKNI